MDTREEQQNKSRVFVEEIWDAAGERYTEQGKIFNRRKWKSQKNFWALRNVSFEILEGECVGVIGLNGAGKSTLSNIISGQIAQTTGQVEINGDVSIIAANAGMQNNLSGRENIRLKGLMVGMKIRK